MAQIIFLRNHPAYQLSLLKNSPEVVFTVPKFNHKTHSKTTVLSHYGVELLVFFLSLFVFTV